MNITDKLLIAIEEDTHNAYFDKHHVLLSGCTHPDRTPIATARVFYSGCTIMEAAVIITKGGTRL